jgi:osmotically-inducible protein OsmY
VKNDLKVRILDDHGRQDAELRGDVLQALMLDAVVPRSIDARVYEGYVTLVGTADWQYQRDEAEFVAGNVFGVVGVIDEVTLVSGGVEVGDVRNAIRKALDRDAKLDADLLSIDTHDGTVTVTGIVGSWAEHDSAMAAAWAAPGVTQVEDHIVVGY